MSLIEDNGSSLHLYADDTQVYGVEVDAFLAKLSEFKGTISNWMHSKPSFDWVKGSAPLSWSSLVELV